jgi:hypothetical protein
VSAVYGLKKRKSPATTELASAIMIAKKAPVNKDFSFVGDIVASLLWLIVQIMSANVCFVIPLALG